MLNTLKRRVFLLLDSTEGNTKKHSIINVFIVTLILLNVLAVIFETIESLYYPNKRVFQAFETFSVLVFTIEYVLRLWSCTEIHRYRHPIKGRLRYFFSISSLIDLLAILPFYMPFVGFDLRFIRMLRIFRFFRFFKLGRYFHASKTLKKVFSRKKEELILSLFIVGILILLASCIMYFVEHDMQPQQFSSIPATMWWSVATLTTIGYGDMYPITTLGKTLAACISVLGIGVFALPAGILASGFSEEFKKVKHKQTCPNCGHVLD